jgi:hypothetical protein
MLLRARFSTPEAGRAAVIDLERHGVADADRIRVQGLPDPVDEEARREMDHETAAGMVGPAVIGATGGAVVGALLGLALGVALGIDPVGLVVLGLAAFGAMAGFFYGGARRLPVTEGALEAPAARGTPVEVVIDLRDREQAELVRLRLEQAGAIRVQSS